MLGIIRERLARAGRRARIHPGRFPAHARAGRRPRAAARRDRAAAWTRSCCSRSTRSCWSGASRDAGPAGAAAASFTSSRTRRAPGERCTDGKPHDLFQRPDDNEDTVRQRLAVYPRAHAAAHRLLREDRACCAASTPTAASTRSTRAWRARSGSTLKGTFTFSGKAIASETLVFAKGERPPLQRRQQALPDDFPAPTATSTARRARRARAPRVRGASPAPRAGSRARPRSRRAASAVPSAAAAVPGRACRIAGPRAPRRRRCGCGNRREQLIRCARRGARRHRGDARESLRAFAAAPWRARRSRRPAGSSRAAGRAPSRAVRATRRGRGPRQTPRRPGVRDPSGGATPPRARRGRARCPLSAADSSSSQARRPAATSRVSSDSASAGRWRTSSAA